MSVDLNRLVAALRDTAEKATATETIERPNHNYQRQNGYGFDEAKTVTETIDKFDRQWIAGRLLGMADTLDAMLSLTPTNPETKEK